MDWLEATLEVYGNVVHPPLVLVLCIFGSIGHLLTVAALFAIINPTNAFLISMSCCQLMLCANFLYSTLFKWASDQACSPIFFSYSMVQTMHVSVSLSVLVHMAGVFHVVALSIIRYFSLARLSEATSNAPWFTYQKCRIIIVIIYASVIILGLPLFFTSEVVEVAENEGCASRFPALRNTSAYQLQFASKPSYLPKINFWLFNFCSKIIPSIVLCIMSLLIVDQLKKIRLLSARFASVSRDRQHQRTTNMILIIMIAFIVVELPQGILAVLSTVSDFHLIYIMGDFNEMITLLTACLIFALFCAMNGRVRAKMAELPCLRPVCHFAQSLFPDRLNSRKHKRPKERKKCDRGPAFTAL